MSEPVKRKSTDSIENDLNSSNVNLCHFESVKKIKMNPSSSIPIGTIRKPSAIPKSNIPHPPVQTNSSYSLHSTLNSPSAILKSYPQRKTGPSLTPNMKSSSASRENKISLQSPRRDITSISSSNSTPIKLAQNVLGFSEGNSTIENCSENSFLYYENSIHAYETSLKSLGIPYSMMELPDNSLEIPINSIENSLSSLDFPLFIPDHLQSTLSTSMNNAETSLKSMGNYLKVNIEKLELTDEEGNISGNTMNEEILDTFNEIILQFNEENKKDFEIFEQIFSGTNSNTSHLEMNEVIILNKNLNIIKNINKNFSENFSENLLQSYEENERALITSFNDNLNILKENKNLKWELKEKIKNYEKIITNLKQTIKNNSQNNTNLKAKLKNFIIKMYLNYYTNYNYLLKIFKNLFNFIKNNRKLTNLINFLVKKINSLLNLIKLYDNFNKKLILYIKNFFFEFKNSENNLKNKEKTFLNDIKNFYDEKNKIMIENNSLNIKISQLEAEREDLHAKSSLSAAEKEKLLEEIKSLTEKLSSTETSLQRSLAECQELKVMSTEQSISINTSINTLKEENIELEKNYMTAKQQCSELQIQNSELNNQINELKNELLTLNNQNKTSKDTYEELKNENDSFKSQISELKNQLLILQTQNTELKSQNAELKSEFADLKSVNYDLKLEKELRLQAEKREENERRERIAYSGQFMALNNDYNKLLLESNQKNDSLKLNYDKIIQELNDKIAKSQNIIKSLEEEIFGLKTQNLNDKAQNFNEKTEHYFYLENENKNLKMKLNEFEMQSKNNNFLIESSKIQELQEKLKESERIRKKLHNIIQELRGNVRVYARVRPFLSSDDIDISNPPESVIQVHPNQTTIKIIHPDLIHGQPQSQSGQGQSQVQEYEFNFDKIFDKSSTQEHLYQEVSEFIQSALDGYNVCLFSYGQTGSGKTHTMNGCGNDSMKGIVPRTIEKLRDYIGKLNSDDFNYSISLSYLEIYNENIKDLLKDYNGPAQVTTTSSSSHNNLYNEENKYEIKRDASGAMYITNLNKVLLNFDNIDEIYSILSFGSQNRTVSSTKMNSFSSRSHSILTFYINFVNKRQKISLNSTLNLIDLAGSERINRSEVSGSNLKESVSINKSLSSLADVFTSISNKSSHIPFRNSKLTYFLQPALSGESKTLMIVNLSPTEASYFESLSSLRFANQVSQCELGKPKRGVKEIAQGDEPVGSASPLKLTSNSNNNISKTSKLSNTIGPIPTSTTPVKSSSIVKKPSFSSSTSSLGSKYLSNTLKPKPSTLSSLKK